MPAHRGDPHRPSRPVVAHTGLEKHAQRYAAQLLLRQGQQLAQPGRAQRAASAQKFFVEVDADSLELCARARWGSSMRRFG